MPGIRFQVNGVDMTGSGLYSWNDFQANRHFLTYGVDAKLAAGDAVVIIATADYQALYQVCAFALGIWPQSNIFGSEVADSRPAHTRLHITPSHHRSSLGNTLIQRPEFTQYNLLCRCPARSIHVLVFFSETAGVCFP